MPASRTLALLSVGSMVLLGACDAVPIGTTTTQSNRSTASTTIARCPVSTMLVPSCGVLWGLATRPQDFSTLRSVETSLGRPVDIVYNYHDINDAIPTDAELREAQQGRILHLAIAARIYGETGAPVTYSGIAAGNYDVDLVRQAKGVASLGEPVLMTFDQEANQRDKLGPRGTAADFRAAWRHIHDLYREAGAANAIWVWVMTGAPDNLARAGQLWPGNDVVDWISWNVYNQSGCGSGSVTPSLYKSFEAAMTPFYDWVHTHGPSLGIAPDKPMMISETGSVIYAGDPRRSARWYANIPSTLEKYPQIKAVTLWDSTTSEACDYRFQQNPAVLAGVAQAGRDPMVLSHSPGNR